MTNRVQSGDPAFMGYLEDRDRRGILAWILSTDHKRIGILYLACMTFLFLAAVTIGVLMRVEQLSTVAPLFSPGSTTLSSPFTGSS